MVRQKSVSMVNVLIPAKLNDRAGLMLCAVLKTMYYNAAAHMVLQEIRILNVFEVSLL